MCFEDVDGEIVGWNWVFEEAVNLDGGIVDRTNLFVDLLSTEQESYGCLVHSGDQECKHNSHRQ